MKLLVVFGILAVVALTSSQEATECSEDIKIAVNEMFDACKSLHSNGTRHRGHHRGQTSPIPNLRSRRQESNNGEEKGPTCFIEKALANKNLEKFMDACTVSDYPLDFQRFSCFMGTIREQCPDLILNRPGGHGHGRKGQDDSSSSEEDV